MTQTGEDRGTIAYYSNALNNCWVSAFASALEVAVSKYYRIVAGMAGVLVLFSSTTTRIKAVEIPKPVINIPKPAINVPKPVINVPRPAVTVNISKPVVNVPKPTVTVNVPKTAVVVPKVDVPKPAVAVTVPKPAVLPKVDTPKPIVSVTAHPTVTGKPTAAITIPADASPSITAKSLDFKPRTGKQIPLDAAPSPQTAPDKLQVTSPKSTSVLGTSKMEPSSTLSKAPNTTPSAVAKEGVVSGASPPSTAPASKPQPDSAKLSSTAATAKVSATAAPKGPSSAPPMPNGNCTPATCEANKQYTYYGADWGDHTGCATGCIVTYQGQLLNNGRLPPAPVNPPLENNVSGGGGTTPQPETLTKTDLPTPTPIAAPLPSPTPSPTSVETPKRTLPANYNYYDEVNKLMPGDAGERQAVKDTNPGAPAPPVASPTPVDLQALDLDRRFKEQSKLAKDGNMTIDSTDPVKPASTGSQVPDRIIEKNVGRREDNVFGIVSDQYKNMQNTNRLPR